MAVSKPDNPVVCLWTCFHPEREGIDWSGFKVAGDLTVQSRSLCPCQWRGHPVGPIRSAWRQCNLSFVTYPAIERQWWGLSPIFIISASFSNQMQPPPKLNPLWYCHRFILLVVYKQENWHLDIQEIDIKSANDAHAFDTLGWASQRENLRLIIIAVSKHWK
jgi:hypothetical protein